jgi:hypothetical protein
VPLKVVRQYAPDYFTADHWIVCMRAAVTSPELREELLSRLKPLLRQDTQLREAGYARRRRIPAPYCPSSSSSPFFFLSNELSIFLAL